MKKKIITPLFAYTYIYYFAAAPKRVLTLPISPIRFLIHKANRKKHHLKIKLKILF